MANKGFTFIEAMLALAILAVVVVSVLEVQVNALRRAREASDAATATVIAKELLAEVALSGRVHDVSLHDVPGRRGFAYRIDVDEVQVPAIGRALRVLVEVRYPSPDGPRGRPGRISVETLESAPRE